MNESSNRINEVFEKEPDCMNLLLSESISQLIVKQQKPLRRIVSLSVVIGIIMRYSMSKINKQNIIETIRNDNI